MDDEEMAREWVTNTSYYIAILNSIIIILSVIFSKISLNKKENKKALIISLIPLITIIPLVLSLNK